MNERILRQFPDSGSYYSLLSEKQQQMLITAAKNILAREHKLQALESLLKERVLEEGNLTNIIWTIKKGFYFRKKDILMFQTATERMAERTLYHNDQTQSITLVNPNKRMERKYYKVAHGHCGCILNESRKTGQPWPSEVNAQSECGSKI